MDPSTQRSIHQQYLCQGLSKLKTSSEFTDVVLVVGDSKFPCHKNVLTAMSTYFGAMFSSGMRESYDGVVILHGINATEFEKVLEFIYTGEIKLSLESVVDILLISSMYQIQSLQLICEQFMCHDLSFQNCLTYWTLSLTYNCSHLETQAFLCVLEYFIELRHTQEFLELSKEELIKCIDAECLKIDREEQVLEAVVFWLDHNVIRAQKYLFEILSYLHFPLMDSRVVHSLTQQSSFLQSNKVCQDFMQKALKAHEDLPVLEVKIQPQAFRHRKADALIMVDGRRQEVCCFNLHSKKLYFLAKFPYFSNSKAACVHQGDVYVSGGYHQANRMVKFITEQNKWDSCLDLLDHRFCHVMVSVCEYIYILGGFSKHERLKPTSIERYNPLTDESCIIGEIPFAMGKMSAAVTGDVIYMFGGRQDHSDYQDDPHLHKPSTIISFNTKTKTSSIVNCVPSITLGSETVTVGDTIYVFSPNGNILTLKSDQRPNIVHILRSVDNRHFRVVHHRGKFYLLQLAAPKLNDEMLVLSWDPETCEEQVLLWEKLPRTLLDSLWMTVVIGKQHLRYECHRR